MDNNENVEVLDKTDLIPKQSDPEPVNTTEPVKEAPVSVKVEDQNISNVSEPEIVQSFENTIQLDEAIKDERHHKNGNKATKIIKYFIASIILLSLLFFSFTKYNFYRNNISTYKEKTTVNYQVCLKENNYYKEKCLNEGVEYITSLTDKIRADFNYSEVYQDTVNKNYSYYIKSNILVKTTDDNAKELYNKDKKLTKDKDINLNGNVLNISESIDVDFNEYNDFAHKYLNDYSLIGNGNLILSLVVKDNTKKEEVEVSSISVPLTQLTYNITKTEIKDSEKTYKDSSNDLLETLLLALSIILCIILFIVVAKLFKTIFGNEYDTKYEKELHRILNTYDRVIVSLKDKNAIIDTNEIYTVQTFLELLDVRDTIDKPILYYKLNELETEFYVQDTDKTYMYTLREADFTDK